MTADPAEIGRITDAAAVVLPALQEWLRYEDLAGPARRRDEWRESLDRPLPERGAGFERTLTQLARQIIPNGLPVGAPGFNGFITTGPTTAAAFAQLAAAIASPQRYAVSAFNELEAISLRWLAELCGLPAGVAGVYSGGGSTANIVALGAARQAAFERIGVDVGRDGLPDGVAGRVYASAESHHSIQRAAAVLGLGREGVRAVPVDDAQRMNIGALAELLARDVGAGRCPVAIVVNAGTTNTGAIDPIGEIADIAARHDVWLHVDGAYGLPAACLPEFGAKLAGIQQAQSWIVDPHKWLATGVGCGATFVRDPELLQRAFTQTPAAYLAVAGEQHVRSPFEDFGTHYDDMGVELSAPPRGVLVWVVLREIGRAGLQARIRRDIGFARRLTETARSHPRLESLIEPELSVAAVRYRPADRAPDDPAIDALNTQVLQRLWRDTPYLPSSTIVNGRYSIRPCYINPRTTMAHVEGLAEAIVRIGDELTH